MTSEKIELTEERLRICLDRMRASVAAADPADVPAPDFIEAMTHREVCAWDVELYELALEALAGRETIAKLKADVDRLGEDADCSCIDPDPGCQCSGCLAANERADRENAGVTL